MKIDQENLLKAAIKLKQTQQKLKETSVKSKEFKKIRVTLDDIGVSLKSHQQTVAKLQLENIGLEQIEKNLDMILKENPADFETIKQAKNKITTAVNSSKFQGDNLIPESIQNILNKDLAVKENLNEVKTSIQFRMNEITGLLETEFSQINKIQVSFENIMSLNTMDGDTASKTIDEIKEQLSIQQKIQSNVNPTTVMGLLNQ